MCNQGSANVCAEPGTQAAVSRRKAQLGPMSGVSIARTILVSRTRSTSASTPHRKAVCAQQAAIVRAEHSVQLNRLSPVPTGPCMCHICKQQASLKNTQVAPACCAGLAGIGSLGGTGCLDVFRISAMFTTASNNIQIPRLSAAPPVETCRWCAPPNMQKP